MKITKSLIPPGEGKTFAGQGAHQIAVYHKDDGSFVTLSADCPHMRCDVAWNNADRTWDCPCHHSRFKADGALMQGPALDPLRMLSSQDLGEELEIKE